MAYRRGEDGRDPWGPDLTAAAGCLDGARRSGLLASGLKTTTGGQRGLNPPREASVATFVLIHGGGGSGWDWHLVEPRLHALGHETVAVDLPISDPKADLGDYVDAAVAAVGDRQQLIVVGHSLGGFTAPLVAGRLHAELLVFLSGMVPLPGEAPQDWWSATGHDKEDVSNDEMVAFYNDVPADLVAVARTKERPEQGGWMERPWPAERLPDLPTKAILGRDDGFFPPDFMRRQIRDRLGIEPDEIPGGHYLTISQPDAVAEQLDRYAREL